MTATKLAAGEAVRAHEQINSSDALVPIADVDRVGLGVGRRSIGRRIKNPPPGFPAVLRINGRLYMQRSELERYKARLIAEAMNAACSVKTGEQAA